MRTVWSNAFSTGQEGGRTVDAMFTLAVYGGDSMLSMCSKVWWLVLHSLHLPLLLLQLLEL